MVSGCTAADRTYQSAGNQHRKKGTKRHQHNGIREQCTLSAFVADTALTVSQQRPIGIQAGATAARFIGPLQMSSPHVQIDTARSASLLRHQHYCSTRYFPALDGLRGLAVLMVVLYHCPRLGLPGAKHLQLAGDAGVDIFFALSGFLITMLLLRDRDNRSASTTQLLGTFFTKRVLRIFPLYYLAIALYWLKVQIGGDGAAIAAFDQSIPYLLTYTIDGALGWGDLDFPAFGIAWSLGVEEKFYLFWPFIVLLCKPRHVLAAGIAVIAATLLWRGYTMQVYSGDLTARMYYAFDLRMDGIMWGAVIACLLHDRRLYMRIAPVLRRTSILLLGGVLFIAAAVLLENSEFLRYLALPLGASCIIGSAVVQLDQPLLRPLCAMPMRYLGRISYGMYVLHPLAISAVTLAIDGQSLLRSLLIIGTAIGLTITLSAASYRWFESPIMRLRTRLPIRTPPTPVPTA